MNSTVDHGAQPQAVVNLVIIAVQILLSLQFDVEEDPLFRASGVLMTYIAIK